MSERRHRSRSINTDLPSYVKGAEANEARLQLLGERRGKNDSHWVRSNVSLVFSQDSGKTSLTD